MTQNIKALDFNGVKVKLDANTRLLLLKITTSASAYRCLHDVRDDTNYQVPAGKKATIIYLEDAPMTNALDKIVYSDAADAGTNEVVLIDPNTPLPDTTFISDEVPATKFINIFDSANGETYKIWIIEEDA